ncbi:MAG: transporter substrate-binding protein, partial [Verrucomicrobiales bacterium]|nr:transporter substrate-binding protein [Verrucomicrobiales bacterium]
LALRGLRDKWEIPNSIAKRATIIIDESGKHRQEQPTVPGAAASKKSSSGPLSKKWRVHLVNYNDSVAADEAIQGLIDGMKASGLVIDRDFTLKQRNGQGDMATLNSIFDAAKADGADLFLIVSTPTLQMAIKKVRDIPIVFTYVSNPMLAGAGESYTNHLPNITGIAVVSAFSEMADLLKKYYPQFKRVGTLFCPAEVNSVYCKDLLVTEAAARGITVESLAVNSTTDLADTSVALASLKIDAIVQISDNITAGGFSAIGRAAQRAHLPLIGFNSSNIKFGAAVVISRDYYEGGLEAAEKAVRVMRGEDPAKIPFELVKKTQRLISLPNAAALGMTIPPGLKASADKVFER